MSDTPGKVLSSLNAAETRGESSSVGGGGDAGCAAAFFHLLDRFHGRRLFPHKGLLPSERPKHSSKSHKEERLPMAKLLLIADENRGGFEINDPVQQSERPEVEAGIRKDEDEERAGIEKRNSRTPSVVARLMGLDSMPSPELPRPQQNEQETHTFPSLEEPPLSPPQTRKARRKGGRVDEAEVLSFKGKPSELHRKRLERYPLPMSRRRKLGRGRAYHMKSEDVDAFSEPISSYSAAIMYSAAGRKASPLPSLQMDLAIRSILSPSKASRKAIASPIKSPLSSKSTALLFEAAAKLLEPNLQPSFRGRNRGICTETARKLPADPANKDKKAGSCTKTDNASPITKHGPPNLPGRPQSFSAEHGLSKCHFSADESSSFKKKDAIQWQRACKHVKDSKHELGFRRRGPFNGDEELQGKATMNERSPGKNVYHAKITAGDEMRTKPTRHKQEETSRRLSQPSNVRIQNLKPAASKQVKGSSPLQKSSQVTMSSSRSTRASRNIPRLSSEPTFSHVSSNCVIDDVLSSNRHLEPCRKGNAVRIGKRSKEMDIVRSKGDSSAMRSLPRKRSLGDRPLAREVCGFVECDSASMETCSDSVSLRAELLSEINDRSCDFDDSCRSIADLEQSISESTGNSMANSSELGATASGDRGKATWKVLDSSSSGMVSSESMKRVSVTSLAESSSQSCRGMQGLEDTASSSYSERRDAVSYCGKTTAAILQELLVALNASKARIRCDERLEDKLEWPPRVHGAATSATSPASGKCGQHDEQERVRACLSEYERNNNSPSAESAAFVQNPLQEGERVPMECKTPPPTGDAGIEESESSSDSLYTEECGQPSPISILESPFRDAASNTSDGFGATRGRGSSEASGSERHGCTSMSGSQAEEVSPLDHRRTVIDCDKLLNTISRMHHIDPAVIGLDSRPNEAVDGEVGFGKEMLRAVSVSIEEAFSRNLLLTGPFIDPALFDKLEEQTQEREWVISASSASLCMEEDEVDSTSRSELGSSFRSHGNEAAAQSRKLILDCIDEALRLSLDGGRLPFGFCSVLVPPSTTHLFGHVYRQVDDWKEMAIGMNLDDMVEKEMNTGAGRWCNFSSEVEDVMEDIESTLFKGLLEELVRDVVSSSWWKVPSKNAGFRFKLPIKVGTAKPTFLGKF